jgi:hypothetical protein
VEVLAVGEALDRGDLGPFVHHCEGKARIDSLAIEQDGTGTTRALIATLLRAGEARALAQQVEQGGPVVDRYALVPAVHRQPDSGAGRLHRFSGTADEQGAAVIMPARETEAPTKVLRPNSSPAGCSGGVAFCSLDTVLMRFSLGFVRYADRQLGRDLEEFRI